MASSFLSRIMEKGCAINNTIWYANALLNGLFKVDLLTGKVSYMGIAEEKEKYLRRAYSEILYYENYLYMIPYNAAAISTYNILTAQFSKITVPEKVYEKFYEAVLIQDKIYLLPYKANKFYCLNTKTKEISEIDELKNLRISVFSSIENDGEIWFAEDGGHRIYSYQPQNKKLREINLDKNVGYFSSVGKVGKKIMVSAIDRALALCIDPQTEDISYFEFEEYSRVKGKRNYYISEYQNKAMLIRIGSNDCVMINIHNGEISENHFLPISLSIYGKIWESELGIAMLPTIRDKAFRFFNGHVFSLNDKSALQDWAKSNNFHWKNYIPMPDYGIDCLFELIDTESEGNLKKGKHNNIYNELKYILN